MIHRHSSPVTQRVQWVSQVIAWEGRYGMVSQMSRQYEVSRQTVYSWKAKGYSSLQAALEPSQPPTKSTVQLERAVLTLLVQGHASYRGIQACLEELLGLHVSLGTITAIVQKAGQRAQDWLGQQVAEQGRVLALDEQYSSKRGEASLNVVDVHSAQVWATLPAVAVDGESWTLVLWYLREQGIVCRGSVSDGGRAIADALQTTKAMSPHQRDVWHLLHLAGQVQARLERVVQAEEDRWLVIERQEQHQATSGSRPAGRPAKTTSSEQEQLLIELHRLLGAVRYLFAQLRELVEVVVLSGEKEPRLLCYQTRRSEVQTVLDLLEEAIQPAPTALQKEVQRVIKQVRLALPALLYFAEQGEAAQHEAIAQLGEAAVGLMAWAWQRRKILGEQPQQLLAALDPAWHSTAARLLEVWNRVVRASSAVENWHSLVRPHLAVHRSLSAGMLALLAVWHNHRQASRGLYQGRSPLMRSGLTQKPGEWLEVLGYPPQGGTPFSPESCADPQPTLTLAA
jgi:transposase-like protein